jgi:putative FmdB family regulatory protein
MPLYEYECAACSGRFELIRKFSDPPVETCTICGKGPVQRLFSSPAIQFKGSGWYITDYAQKGKSGKSDSSAEKSTKDKGDSTTSTDGAAKSDTAAKPASSSSTNDTKT